MIPPPHKAGGADRPLRSRPSPRLPPGWRKDRPGGAHAAIGLWLGNWSLWRPSRARPGRTSAPNGAP
eukprot:8940476-Lingulodinium_polyedra.AAC.1